MNTSICSSREHLVRVGAWQEMKSLLLSVEASSPATARVLLDEARERATGTLPGESRSARRSGASDGGMPADKFGIRATGRLPFLRARHSNSKNEPRSSPRARDTLPEGATHCPNEASLIPKRAMRVPGIAAPRGEKMTQNKPSAPILGVCSLVTFAEPSVRYGHARAAD